MIHVEPDYDNPIIKEVRENRKAISAECDHDINKYFAHLEEREKLAQKAGVQFANLEPAIPADLEERVKAYWLEKGHIAA